MREYLDAFKQKIQYYRANRKNNKPQLLENIHSRLFQRSYDLDYLQWIQRNSTRYMMGMALLVVLLIASVYVPQSTETQTTLPFYTQQAAQPSQDQPAFQDITQTDISEQSVSSDMVDNLAVQTDAAEPEPQAELPIPSAEPEPEYINPLELTGYTAPTNGQLQYGYGLGYDAIHEDYRFHTDVCYAAGNGEVLACTEGMVTKVHPQEQWQITIQCAAGTVQYAGLYHCDVQAGDAVLVGEKIGNAKENVYVRAGQ